METEIEQTIPGELKTFEVDYDFTFRGERFTKGERLEVTADDAKALMQLRTHAKFEDSRLHVLAGRLTGGGLFTLERCTDGGHKLSFWHRRYEEGDDWVLVECLEDFHGWGVKAGDRRRLRRSDAREMFHRYIDTSPQAATYHSARILILEPRPKPAISPEEAERRAAAVEEGMARDRTDNWVLGIKRI